MTMTNDYALYFILMSMMKFILLFLAEYSTTFITLIWRLCGCWITEKLAPTQSETIFGLSSIDKQLLF